MLGVVWSKEREALLRNLWAKGMSGSQVAAEMGGGVTRNAVIGKVNRLGIGDMKGRVTLTGPGPKPLSMSKRNIRTRELRAARKAGVAPPPAPPVERRNRSRSSTR